VVNFIENEKVGYDYILAEAKKLNNEKALTEITRLGPPPYAKDKLMDVFRVKGKWLDEFNGVIYDKESLKQTPLGEQYFSGKMYTRSKEYSFWDLFKSKSLMWVFRSIFSSAGMITMPRPPWQSNTFRPSRRQKRN
jgi:hypothetical protein